MEVVSLEIPEVKLIKPRRFKDDRGFFEQSYHKQQYWEAGIEAHFVQDNHSQSEKGALRGLHYQLEHAQAKLVSVIRGAVFDVAVDIRQGSPTFGQWVGAELTAENGHQLFVPKGFAHGFAVLSEVADFVYKCDDFYTAGDEYGIRWDDPSVGVGWPELQIEWLLSGKDRQAPFLRDVPASSLPVY